MVVRERTRDKALGLGTVGLGMLEGGKHGSPFSVLLCTSGVSVTSVGGFPWEKVRVCPLFEGFHFSLDVFPPGMTRLCSLEHAPHYVWCCLYPRPMMISDRNSHDA